MILLVVLLAFAFKRRFLIVSFDNADEVSYGRLTTRRPTTALKMKAKFIWQDKQSAIEHFFRKGNLIALRELFALRRMADRVDSQVKEFVIAKVVRLFGILPIV